MPAEYDAVAGVHPAVAGAVGFVNTKFGAEYATQLMQTGISDHIHQQRLDNELGSLLHHRLARSVAEMDPVEAASLVTQRTGNDSTGGLTQIGMAIAGISMLLKGAGTPPPSNAPGT